MPIKPLDFAAVLALAQTFPGVEEGVSYGTPALKVGKKLMARLRDEGETLVVACDQDAAAELIRAKPAVFFLTDHYKGYDYVLVRLAKVGQRDLNGLLERAWLRVAPPKLLKNAGR